MRLPVILLATGALLFLVSLTADITTIGEGTAFGWKQIAGAAVGVIVAAVGMIQLRKKTGD